MLLACVAVLRADVAQQESTKVQHLRQASSPVPSQSRSSEDELRAETVRGALRFLWNGYRETVWGADEVKPVTGKVGDRWGNVGMTILDSLDTLYLAGLEQEFSQGLDFVASLSVEPPANGYRTSFFELVIRGLGGLLACHAVSDSPVCLDKAKEFGEHLLLAFDRSEGDTTLPWPAAYIDIRNPRDAETAAGWMGNKVALADVGSNLLEFVYLSQATGDARFEEAAVANENRLLQLAADQGKHLQQVFLRANARKSDGGGVSVGAYGDSYYEYLLKGYIQSNGANRELLQEFKAAMNEMRQELLREAGHHTYIGSLTGDHVMEHLTCFMGGLLALGAHVAPKEDREDWWLPTAIDVTETCYQMYHQSPSGLAPDIAHIGEKITSAQGDFRVRPETLESLFILHRITGNATYKDMSWEIFQAIDKHTRTTYGFSSLVDVTVNPPQKKNSEETFVGAETFKYALLIHLPVSVLPLDRFVLNTEAHPMPIEARHVL